MRDQRGVLVTETVY